MTDGNKLRQQLAGQLYDRVGGPPGDPGGPSRRGGTSSPPPGREMDPATDLINNPLYLASDIAVPGDYAAGYDQAYRGGRQPDLRIDVDAPPAVAGSVGAASRRNPTIGERFSAALEALSRGNSNPSSPRRGNIQSEIEEVGPMPRDDYNNPIDVDNINYPIDVENLNVIGPLPPGYLAKEVSPVQRALKEAHRIWVVPALGQLPAFFENWWKKFTASRKGRPKSPKGLGAALQGIQEKTLELRPDELFSTHVAAGVILFLVAAFLIYAWLEQQKRNDEVVLDTSRYNLDRNKVVSLVPKKRYLLDLAGLGSQTNQQQVPRQDTHHPPGTFHTPYQYPPLRGSQRSSQRSRR